MIPIDLKLLKVDPIEFVRSNDICCDCLALSEPHYKLEARNIKPYCPVSLMLNICRVHWRMGYPLDPIYVKNITERFIRISKEK